MRVVPIHEKMKRGCAYCAHMQKTRDAGTFRTGCPFDECPYRVLDKYRTYEDFMASEDSKILVDGFFQTSASCYEPSNGNATVKQVFGDKELRGFM